LSDKLKLGQTEQYVEYDRAGRVVKGAEPETAKSKYPEDECLNNHTAVWGSWWNQGTWGFACCHSTVKNSYCTGASGIAAAQASASLMQNNLANKAAADEEKKKESKLGTELKTCVTRAAHGPPNTRLNCWSPTHGSLAYGAPLWTLPTVHRATHMNGVGPLVRFGPRHRSTVGRERVESWPRAKRSADDAGVWDGCDAAYHGERT